MLLSPGYLCHQITKNKTMKFLKSFSILFVLAFLAFNVQAQDVTNDVTVIELSQVPGAFESGDLTLPAGKYLFKIANKTVDHEVGFVIQKASDKDGDVMKTALANSFSEALIAEGKSSSTGIVELNKGEYVYSCPLNPTPKYKITVQ